MENPVAVRSLALTTAHSDPRAIGYSVATEDAIVGDGIVLHWVDLHMLIGVRQLEFREFYAMIIVVRSCANCVVPLCGRCCRNW
jgi:hypothetical protein